MRHSLKLVRVEKILLCVRLQPLLPPCPPKASWGRGEQQTLRDKFDGTEPSGLQFKKYSLVGAGN